MSARVQRGTNGASLDLADVRVEVVCCAPGKQFELHRHEHSCLAIVIRGSVRSRGSRRTLECRPGNVALVEADEMHVNSVSDRGSTQVLISTRDERSWPDSFARPTRSLLALPEVTRLAIEIAGELTTADTMSALGVEAAVSDVLASWRRAIPVRRRPEWIGRVRDRLRDEPCSLVSIEQLAADVHVHSSYLTRVFRACFGTSIAAYARTRRVEMASVEVLQSDRALVEIAARHGFADQSHMTRAFTEAFGTPPARLRARLLRDEPNLA